MNYSGICDHLRLDRIDENCVKCLNCGESMINQVCTPKNKKSVDFVNEVQFTGKNFGRNFSNIVEEDNKENIDPIYEYYTDKSKLNRITVNRKSKFQSFPPKYEVNTNGSISYLTNNEIKKMLMDIHAIRLN